MGWDWIWIKMGGNMDREMDVYELEQEKGDEFIGLNREMD